MSAQRWTAKFKGGLGMVVSSERGEHIATVYEHKQAPLIAAAPALLYQLQAAREFIALDRLNLVDAHMDPLTNAVEECAKGEVAEYDVMLAGIDAAIAKAVQS